MASVPFERTVARRVRTTLAGFGVEVRRLREDAGLSRSELARAVGLDPSFLADIEAGRANPSLESCTRLSLGLGADLPLRLYPTTGATVRDRHQSSIAESLLTQLHPRWRTFSEIAVRRPSRGWIDLGLFDSRSRVLVATEIQSDLRRIEQLIRWTEDKAAALPSWDGWTSLGGDVTTSRLLVVRETRTNRAVAAEFRHLLRSSFPASPLDAIDALFRQDGWPGAALLWAARDRHRHGYRIAARR
jgi:transcriptional regulator with XRE-family HTH domain